jgi:hypothetical protein
VIQHKLNTAGLTARWTPPSIILNLWLILWVAMWIDWNEWISASSASIPNWWNCFLLSSKSGIIIFSFNWFNRTCAFVYCSSLTIFPLQFFFAIFNLPFPIGNWSQHSNEWILDSWALIDVSFKFFGDLLRVLRWFGKRRGNKITFSC